MPNPLLTGNIGRSAYTASQWPWERSRASGELFAERISTGQLSIGKELAEGNALPPPPDIGTVLHRSDPPRANSKLWSAFKQTMKRDYNMNEKWLDLRAGPLKTLFGDLHHLRRYLQGLRSEDEKLGAYIKDLREATVRSMNEISRFNELHINDGVFRRFLTEHVPEIDGKPGRENEVPVGGPTDQDPEQEELVKKLTAWFQ